jgi:hypothetical protein
MFFLEKLKSFGSDQEAHPGARRRRIAGAPG